MVIFGITRWNSGSGTVADLSPSMVWPSFRRRYLIMIDFEISLEVEAARKRARENAERLFRPISCYSDEHEIPDDLMRILWQRNISGRGFPAVGGGRLRPEAVLLVEETFWGDAGLALSAPGPGLAGAAITASATPEQRERFLKRFTEGEPKWGCMAITEPGCGSDTAAIQTTAVRDGDEWVLNGEKMFASKAKRALDSGGIIVVWATVDKSAGRAGIKPFVVEAGTPGVRVEKVEKKLGIRAEETCVLVLDNCRIPYDNILGSPEVIDKTKTEGFKRAMATFDFTRPFVAAMALL
ncbi:MAG: hypothetical protein DRI26_06345, partial [Chloroflexi bacterium]